MTDTFYILSHCFEPNAAVLTDLTGIDFRVELSRGISHAHDFPDDATIKMSDDYPTNNFLPDSVTSTANITIISKKLKDFLESREIPDVEYFPITILDHRNNPVEAIYFIANPINNIDCLDIDACSPRWCEFDSEWMRKVKKLAIIPEKVPSERELFRPRHYDGNPIINKTLADALEKEGFTGIGLAPVSEFKGRI